MKAFRDVLATLAHVCCRDALAVSARGKATPCMIDRSTTHGGTIPNDLGRGPQFVHEILKRTQLVESLNFFQTPRYDVFGDDPLSAFDKFGLNVGNRERILWMTFHFPHELAHCASVARLNFDNGGGGERYGLGSR